MKNKFLTFLTASAIFGYALVAQAQNVVSFSLATSNAVTNLNTLAGVNLPTNPPIHVSKITISVPTAASVAAGFFFYDWYAGFQTNLWATNIISFTNATVVNPFTNNVVFTNSLGRTNTNTYIGIATFYTNVTTANTTSSVPAIGGFSVNPGSTITVDVNWNIAQGLAIRGTNNRPDSTIVLEYK